MRIKRIIILIANIFLIILILMTHVLICINAYLIEGNNQIHCVRLV